MKVKLLLLALCAAAALNAAPMKVARVIDRAGQSSVKIMTPARTNMPGLDGKSAPVQGFRIETEDGELLGYSETGTIDVNNLPPAMMEWLETASPVRKGLPVHNPVNAMTLSKWGQDFPYNNYTPVLNGKRASTGCAATAMAQIVAYQGMTPRGKDQIKIRLTTVGGPNPVYKDSIFQYNFSDNTYNYSNLTAGYDSTSPAVKQHEVAQLMRDCGYMLGMNYTPDVSLSTEDKALAAFPRYFDCDSAVHLSKRVTYSYFAWDSMLYAEMKADRPVMYFGTNYKGESGHAFVVDGYDQGLYHVNWGWDGQCDGYFSIVSLNALNPTSMQANDLAFCNTQTMITGIRPNAHHQAVKEVRMPRFSVDETTPIVLGQPSKYHLSLTNCSCLRESFDCSVVLFQNGTQVETTVYNKIKINNFQPGSTIDTAFSYTLPATLADGTYEIAPVIKRTGESWWVPALTSGGRNTYKVVVAGGKVTSFTRPTGDAPMSTNWTVGPTEMYPGDSTEYVFRVWAEDYEFHGLVSLGFSGQDTAFVIDNVVAAIPAGDSIDCHFTVKLPVNIRLGEYSVILGFLDFTGEERGEITLSEKCTVIAVPSNLEGVLPSDESGAIIKVLRDGQLIIIRDGVEYNAMGQIVE